MALYQATPVKVAMVIMTPRLLPVYPPVMPSLGELFVLLAILALRLPLFLSRRHCQRCCREERLCQRLLGLVRPLSRGVIKVNGKK